MLTLTSPVKTWAHRMPAGLKLAALCVVTWAVFRMTSPEALGLAALAAAALTLTGGATFAAAAVRMLRPLVPFVVIVALWHGATGAPADGAAVILRLLTAFALANFVTMTTTLSEMIAVIQTLARPLSRFGLQPRTLALAVALTIRFIPVMLLRTEVIREGWRARSPRRPGWRILIPATLATIDDADHVAEALRARGGVG